MSSLRASARWTSSSMKTPYCVCTGILQIPLMGSTPSPTPSTPVNSRGPHVLVPHFAIFVLPTVIVAQLSIFTASRSPATVTVAVGSPSPPILHTRCAAPPSALAFPGAGHTLLFPSIEQLGIPGFRMLSSKPRIRFPDASRRCHSWSWCGRPCAWLGSRWRNVPPSHTQST